MSLLSEPVRLADLTERLAAHGLRLVEDAPVTHGQKRFVYDGDDGRLIAHCDATAGAVRLLFGAPELEARLAPHFALESRDQALAALAAAPSPAERITRAYRASVFLLDGDPATLDALGALLLDEAPLVRWAMARLLRHRADRGALAWLERAAERWPELAGTRDDVAESCALNDEGMLHDTPTDAWWELVRRAREGLANGQWKRADQAVAQLVEQDAAHALPLLFRALIFEREGRTALARGLLAAAAAAARDRGDDEALPEIEGHLGRLTDGVTVPADAAEISRWFERWDYRTSLKRACAEALGDAIPELAACFGYLRADGDPDALARVAALAPDGPEVWNALGFQLRDADVAGALAHLERAWACAQVPREERSEAARSLDARVEPEDVARNLTTIAYDHQRYEDAAYWAEAWIEAAPDDTTALRYRANALIFALRHEEAVQALRTVLDADADFGGQTRFNLACVLARLGRRDEALDELRLAVRASDRWRDDARTDDYFDALWGDPAFLAIVAGEPAALLLPHERDPAWLDQEFMHGIGLLHRDRVRESIAACSAALLVAEATGRPGMAARVRAVAARAHARDGDLDEALALGERAMLGLEHVAEPDRAEVVHTWGIVLQEAGRFDEAEDALRRALDLRAELLGAAHPALAKSWGDLARLLGAMGRPQDEVEAATRHGLALLHGWLARPDVARDDDVWREAVLDAATLEANLVWGLGLAGEIDAAHDALPAVLDRIAQAFAEHIPVAPAFLDNVASLIDALRASTGDPGRALALDDMATRLQLLQLDGPPEEVAERLFWRRLASAQRRTGLDDATFAGLIQRALRGELGASELAATPELAGFAAQLGEQVHRYPTLLVMAGLSLDLVQSGGISMRRALEDLEEICVGSLYEATLAGGAE